MGLAYSNILVECKLWITDEFMLLNLHATEDYRGTLVYVMTFLF